MKPRHPEDAEFDPKDFKDTKNRKDLKYPKKQERLKIFKKINKKNSQKLQLTPYFLEQCIVVMAV